MLHCAESSIALFTLLTLSLLSISQAELQQPANGVVTNADHPYVNPYNFRLSNPPPVEEKPVHGLRWISPDDISVQRPLMDDDQPAHQSIEDIGGSGDVVEDNGGDHLDVPNVRGSFLHLSSDQLEHADQQKDLPHGAAESTVEPFDLPQDEQTVELLHSPQEATKLKVEHDVIPRQMDSQGQGSMITLVHDHKDNRGPGRDDTAVDEDRHQQDKADTAESSDTARQGEDVPAQLTKSDVVGDDERVPAQIEKSDAAEDGDNDRVPSQLTKSDTADDDEDVPAQIAKSDAAGDDEAVQALLAKFIYSDAEPLDINPDNGNKGAQDHFATNADVLYQQDQPKGRPDSHEADSPTGSDNFVPDAVRKRLWHNGIFCKAGRSRTHINTAEFELQYARYVNSLATLNDAVKNLEGYVEVSFAPRSIHGSTVEASLVSPKLKSIDPIVLNMIVDGSPIDGYKILGSRIPAVVTGIVLAMQHNRSLYLNGFDGFGEIFNTGMNLIPSSSIRDFSQTFANHAQVDKFSILWHRDRGQNISFMPSTMESVDVLKTLQVFPLLPANMQPEDRDKLFSAWIQSRIDNEITEKIPVWKLETLDYPLPLLHANPKYRGWFTKTFPPTVAPIPGESNTHRARAMATLRSTGASIHSFHTVARSLLKLQRELEKSVMKFMKTMFAPQIREIGESHLEIIREATQGMSRSKKSSKQGWFANFFSFTKKSRSDSSSKRSGEEVEKLGNVRGAFKCFVAKFQKWNDEAIDDAIQRFTPQLGLTIGIVLPTSTERRFRTFSQKKSQGSQVNIDVLEEYASMANMIAMSSGVQPSLIRYFVVSDNPRAVSLLSELLEAVEVKIPLNPATDSHLIPSSMRNSNLDTRKSRSSSSSWTRWFHDQDTEVTRPEDLLEGAYTAGQSVVISRDTSLVMSALQNATIDVAYKIKARKTVKLGIGRAVNTFNEALSAVVANAAVDLHLLSMCEELIYPSESQFGAVAAGLGGVYAHIVTQNSPLKFTRSMSTEPCFTELADFYMRGDKSVRYLLQADPQLLPHMHCSP